MNLDADWGFSLGALGILGACALWGIDNNFTRNISAKDPLAIVAIKGLASGSLSLIAALSLGNNIPSWKIVLVALSFGSLSYGASIVLFIRAMRGLGAARTSVLFSTAPVAGIIMSILTFQDFPGWPFLAALPFMLLGAYLLISDRHEHYHVHEMLVHEHSHFHDDRHHGHGHDGGSSEEHSHIHSHGRIYHSHNHMPDLHHRHAHSSESKAG